MQPFLPTNSAIFLCDIQDKLGAFINEYSAVVDTALKMIKIAKILEIPIILTEQNPKALGSTNPTLRSALEDLGDLYHGAYEKKLFSMVTSDVESTLRTSPKLKDTKNVLICGMEAHICVLQTVLDLTQRGYTVYVLADGVSSCNKEEVPIALEMSKQAGAYVTTSEAVGFRLMGSADLPNFKAFATLIKEEKEGTKTRLKRLCAL